MSLLSPKPVSICLSGARSWLRQGGLELEVRTDQGIPHQREEYQALLQTHLKNLLVQAKGKCKPGSQVLISVADHVALVASLPWQDALMNSEELLGFAAYHLSKNGIKIDDSWQVHGEYPRFSHAGLAYAMPKGFLHEVVESTLAAELRPIKILPYSARVFFSQHFNHGKQSSLMLIEEEFAVTAWRIQAGQITSSIEPVVADSQTAIRRLLLRVAAAAELPTRLQYWSPCRVRSSQDFKKFAPDVSDFQIHDDAWWVQQ